MNNNASAFLQYVQNPASLLNNPQLTAFRQKYNAANPQQLAMQQAQKLGITPDQHDQWDCSDQLADIVWVVN